MDARFVSCAETTAQEVVRELTKVAGQRCPTEVAAFEQCRDKWEPVVIYTSPPPGRSHFMINWSRHFDPRAAASGEMPAEDFRM